MLYNYLNTHRNFSLEVDGETGLSLSTVWTKVVGVDPSVFVMCLGNFRLHNDIQLQREDRGAFSSLWGGSDKENSLDIDIAISRITHYKIG